MASASPLLVLASPRGALPLEDRYTRTTQQFFWIFFVRVTELPSEHEVAAETSYVYRMSYVFHLVR